MRNKVLYGMIETLQKQVNFQEKKIYSQEEEIKGIYFKCNSVFDIMTAVTGYLNIDIGYKNDNHYVVKRQTQKEYLIALKKEYIKKIEDINKKLGAENNDK